jgi:hypothetical protein
MPTMDPFTFRARLFALRARQRKHQTRIFEPGPSIREQLYGYLETRRTRPVPTERLVVRGVLRTERAVRGVARHPPAHAAARVFGHRGTAATRLREHMKRIERGVRLGLRDRSAERERERVPEERVVRVVRERAERAVRTKPERARVVGELGAPEPPALALAHEQVLKRVARRAEHALAAREHEQRERGEVRGRFAAVASALRSVRKGDRVGRRRQRGRRAPAMRRAPRNSTQYTLRCASASAARACGAHVRRTPVCAPCDRAERGLAARPALVQQRASRIQHVTVREPRRGRRHGNGCLRLVERHQARARAPRARGDSDMMLLTLLVRARWYPLPLRAGDVASARGARRARSSAHPSSARAAKSAAQRSLSSASARHARRTAPARSSCGAGTLSASSDGSASSGSRAGEAAGTEGSGGDGGMGA